MVIIRNYLRKIFWKGGRLMERLIQELNPNKIKAAMVEKGFTQANLAEKVNISKVHLSQVLNGKAALKVDLLIKIAEVVEKPISYFFDAKHC